MIDTSLPIARTLCCLDGVWQLVASPPPREAVQASLIQSVLEMDRHVASLEATILALRLEAESARFDVREVEHRLKNAFAIVHALAMRTTRPGDAGEAFRTTFRARLLALARAHEMLGSGHRGGAPLAGLKLGTKPGVRR